MIPKIYITEWGKHVPWLFDMQLEQDLLISRVLVELFSNPHISDALAFRGGTALYKLFLTPAPRYSEDIDLVQRTSEPIGDILTEIRKILDPLLGEPKRKFGAGRVTITYRFNSEENPPTPMRLKIEINTREHFTVLGFVNKKFAMSSPWFEGKADVPTYQLEELMGTKLRALFQRHKGRDLFDLWYAFKQADLAPQKVVDIFYHYIEKQGLIITRAQYQQNLHEKAETDLYLEDVKPLLAPDLKKEWNVFEALKIMNTQIFPCLRGESWKGRSI